MTRQKKPARSGPYREPPAGEGIRRAITQKRLIRFIYGGADRIAEPHDYGLQGGALRLLSYQVGGKSTSGRLPAWRLVDVPKMSEVNVLETRFAGGRPLPTGKHLRWDEIFLRVEGPEDEDCAG